MFRGRFVHTMDSKGRVSIPSGFRMELQRRSERAPILTNADQCLLLYPYEDWCDFEQQHRRDLRPSIRTSRPSRG